VTFKTLQVVLPHIFTMSTFNYLLSILSMFILQIGFHFNCRVTSELKSCVF